MWPFSTRICPPSTNKVSPGHFWWRRTSGVGDGDGNSLHLDAVDADGLHRLRRRRQLRRVQRHHPARRRDLGQGALLPATHRRLLGHGGGRGRRGRGGHGSGGGRRRGDGVLQLHRPPLAGTRLKKDLTEGDRLQERNEEQQKKKHTCTEKDRTKTILKNR